MSKEYLEALERMCSTTLEEDLSVRDIYETEYGIVEQALQRLESIDNSNPSEALECLEALEQDIKDRVILAEDRQLKLCAVIKQALLKAQKEHKALEVLEKIIDFDLVEIGSRKVCIYSDDDNGDVVRAISEEEFNALEEVL